jgi:hypothetical protein
MSEPSFELWLEFEHWQSTPGDDPENDFFNMHIYTSDGNRYALNVWTYRFLQEAIERDRQIGENLNGSYLLPPDLFVGKLDRALIEAVTTDLIRERKLRKEWLILD